MHRIRKKTLTLLSRYKINKADVVLFLMATN